jgi:hypothetical protein
MLLQQVRPPNYREALFLLSRLNLRQNKNFLDWVTHESLGFYKDRGNIHVKTKQRTLPS